MRKLVPVLAAVAFLVACGRWGSHSTGAVAQAINDHLSQNSHLISSNFNTEVEKVNFNGNKADALVKFKSKQSAAIFVEVRYSLQFEKGRWEVVSSAPMSGQGGDSHGDAPADQPTPLPPGHPTLPPDHPALPPLQPSH